MAGGGFGGGFYPHAYNMQAFDHMLARWAGVDTAGEERVQAETIAEKFMNEQTVNAYGNPLFYQIFEKFSTELGVRFYAQVAELNEHAVFFKLVESFRAAVPANGVSFSQAELEAILAPAQALFSSPPTLDPDLERFALLDFDFGSDSLGGDIAGFIDAELQSYNFDPAQPWEGYSDWYLDRKPLLETIDREGLVLDERHRAYTLNRDLRIFELPNAVYNEVAGGPGDDTLHGDPSGTLVKIDLITGGAGNDILLGGQGDDTYVFSDGSGADIVSDLVGNNEIAFQGGLISTLARYSFADDDRQDLLISFAGRSETVTILGYFDVNGAPTLERITFPDGLQASGRPIRDVVFASLATAGDDVITSFPLATTIIGLAGNDILTGRGHGDVLVGGAGNDILSGGGGDDVYRFAPGDGHDIIRDYSNGHNGWGGSDTIEFGEGIAPSDVTITQPGGGWNLVLTLATGGSVTLESDVNDSNYRIEQIVFADGTVWTHAQMMAVLLSGTAADDTLAGGYEPETITGGAGDDSVEGRGGDDILSGGSGNDLLSGSGGNDLYRFGLGDGDDIVREYTNGNNGWGGIDMVEFGQGVAPADISVTAAESGTDLVLTIAATGEKITLDSTVNNSNYRVEHVRFADGTIWTHADMMAVILAGTPANDLLYGGYEAETIAGAAGNDMIEGRAGNDILTGGLDNDLLHGSGGDDTYRFGRGDGDDIIREYTNGYHGWGGNDTIEFEAGIVPSDIVVTQADSGTDLVLTIAGTTDRITIDSGLGVSNYRVEQVRFADGTLWSYADLVARSTGGTPGNDTLSGDGAANTISGGAGNDTIEGRYGDDLLVGGTGNDILSGSGGNDTYVFVRGDGADIVREFSRTTNGSEGFDTIEFGEGILPSEIAVTQVDSGWDLVLTIAGTTDSITLDNDVLDVRSRIEQVVFADGTVWTHADLMAKVHVTTAGADNFAGSWEDDTLSGGAGNDTLKGHGGTDILTGGTGSDRLEGGAGADTYVYNLGDGDDVIYDYKENDTAAMDMIVFGAGITPATLIFSRVAADWDDIRIGFVGHAGSIIIDNQHWADTGIESIKFADGTIWDHAEILERYVFDQQTAGNDIINGTHFAETILAGAGNDSVHAGAGTDTLVGGTGNDRLEGGAEADTYVYNLGDGDDVIYDYKENDTAATDMIVFGPNITPAALIFSRVAGDWNDIRIGFVGQAGSIIIDNQHWADTGIESIKFADGTIWDHTKILERYLADQQTPGNDTINGSHLADIVNGGAGDDLISAGSGDDVLSGGPGNDRLEGSDGSDTYLYNAGDGHDVVQDYKGTRNNILQFGEGITQAELLVSRPQGDATSIRISFKTLPGSVTILNQTWSDAGVETIRFQNGSLSEAALIQMIGAATNGSDSLAGTSAADVIWALEGADVVTGLAGADTLHGQDGDDVLIGGEGSDTLTGGAGVDTFRVNPDDSGLGAAADRITDFLSGTDRVDLAAIDADANVAGNQAFSFIGSAAFGSVAGQLRVAYDGMDTWLEADTNGDGTADFQIVLSGSVVPVTADFVL